MKIFSLFLALACALAGCSDDRAEKAMNDEAPVAGNAPAPSPAPRQPLSAEQRETANRTLEFSNLATGALTDGYYALPDALYNNVDSYLKTWRLPKRPKTPKKPAALAEPPRGIFTEQEAAALAGALKGMDRALDSMRLDYGALERYVGDDEIRDDGREGKRLGKKIAASHTEFMRAKKTWLEMLEQKAEAAQTLLLREHPLERQVLAAGKVFNIFRQITQLLAADEPERANVGALAENLRQVLADAAKPPFPAAPGLERAYRGFLKVAGVCLGDIDAGLREGFFGPQKRAIAAAMEASREAYNAFAAQANQSR